MKIPRIGPRNTIIILTVTAVVTLSIYFAIHTLKTFLDLRDDINCHSDMSMLNAGIREELQKYYKKKGSYPESLQLIKETVLIGTYPSKIPEGPNAIDYFNEFIYSTDGNSYSVTYEAKHGETVYTHQEEGQKGGTPQTKLYINGKLFERNQK
jgi:hypothetical protein